MGSRYMDYPSPRGVHVPESYYANLDPDDPYRPPSSRKNRYSRSVHQTPRIRDVTWISSPGAVTPQTPHAPPSPWLPPTRAPSSPAYRLPSPIPPSPAPTVGEHMTLDEFAFVQDDVADPYRRPQAQRPGVMKSLWRGLKKLSGFQPFPSFPIPRPSSYESQTVKMPMPGLSVPSEATQYVNPTPSETTGTTETEERRSATPYVRAASVGATPAVIPSSLRASPVRIPSMEIPPPITIVSPSIPSSPLPNSIRSARVPSPAPTQRNLSMSAPEPVGSAEGSQTLHEPVYPSSAFSPLVAAPIPMPRPNNLKFLQQNGGGIVAPVVEGSSSKGLQGSTMGRFRRFVADLDGLPWVSDTQIADEYIPEKNPRSRLRAEVRQGAEPSWYTSRPEVVESPAYWSEWDMWAKQSTAALRDGTLSGYGRVGWAGVGAGGGLGQGPGQWEAMYPHGYMPVQPGLVYPSGYPPPGMVSDQLEGHAPVLP